MTCDEAEILLHALIDGELDAGHARDVEDAYRRLSALHRGAGGLSRDEQGRCRRQSALRRAAALRQRIEASLPQRNR